MRLKRPVTLYSAIDQVVDKIEAQLKRRRSKIRERKTENARAEAATEEAAEERVAPVPGESLPSLLRS